MPSQHQVIFQQLCLSAVEILIQLGSIPPIPNLTAQAAQQLMVQYNGSKGKFYNPWFSGMVKHLTAKTYEDHELFLYLHHTWGWMRDQGSSVKSVSSGHYTDWFFFHILSGWSFLTQTNPNNQCLKRQLNALAQTDPLRRIYDPLQEPYNIEAHDDAYIQEHKMEILQHVSPLLFDILNKE